MNKVDRLMERRTKFVRTNEDWYPSLPPNFRPANPKYHNPLNHAAVIVSMLHLSNGQWRVCVWGADDMGMDFDQPSRMVALEMYKRIVDFTTKKQLVSWGFVHA